MLQIVVANRSYLYTATLDGHADAKNFVNIRGFGEWAYEIPMAHCILVAFEPQICKSWIDAAQPVGICADSKQGAEALLRVLDRIAVSSALVDKTEFEQAASATKEMLAETFANKEDQPTHFLLEALEIFEMDDVSEQAAFDRFWQTTLPQVQRNLDAALQAESSHWIDELAKDWKRVLGLHWSKELYFDFSDSETDDLALPAKAEVSAHMATVSKKKPWWKFWD